MSQVGGGSAGDESPPPLAGSPTLLTKIKIKEEGKQMETLSRTLQGARLFSLLPRRNPNPPLPGRRQTWLWKSLAIQGPESPLPVGSYSSLLVCLPTPVSPWSVFSAYE